MDLCDKRKISATLKILSNVGTLNYKDGYPYKILEVGMYHGSVHLVLYGVVTFCLEINLINDVLFNDMADL